MSLTLKPHLVQLCPPDAPVDTVTNQVLATEFHQGRQIRCRVAPTTAEAAFNEFGVQLNAEHKLLCELADAPTDADMNAKIRFDGTWYRVAGIVRHGSTPECGYASVLLARSN